VLSGSPQDVPAPTLVVVQAWVVVLQTLQPLLQSALLLHVDGGASVNVICAVR